MYLVDILNKKGQVLQTYILNYIELGFLIRRLKLQKVKDIYTLNII